MWSVAVGDNSNGEAADGFSAKADLCRKAGTEIVVSRKRYLGQRLKHGALSSRLVTTDNNLRQRQDTLQAAFSDLGDSVENASLFVGLQLL